MGSSLYLTIRDPEVKKSEIKDIALKFERVDHCQFSGEILSGGNRFVDINYSQKARDILATSSVATTTGTWVCSGCSEEIDGRFDACWKCGRDRE